MATTMRLLQLIFLFKLLQKVLGVPCGAGVIGLIATENSQTLLSPNYPLNYEHNQTCKWILTAQDANKKVQIDIVSLDLANRYGVNCEDYLEFRDGFAGNAEQSLEGDKENSTFIKKTCSEKNQIKSKGQHLFVTFVTDLHFSSAGFAFTFYQIHDYKSNCDPYFARTLLVGQNPLFLDLPLFSETVERETFCDYHLKSEWTDDVSLSLELLTYSAISCEDGNFSIYDGANAKAPLILEWCYSNKPFERLISSERNLFLRFKLLKTLGRWYVFRAKVTVRMKSVSCSDKSIPNLEVNSVPSYIAFPLESRLKSKRACPLRIWSNLASETVRLQLVSKHHPSCGKKDVNLYSGYDLHSPKIGSLCEKKIYVSAAHSLVLHPNDDNSTDTIFIKLSSVASNCSGQVEVRTAVHDIIKYLPEVANPKLGYSHDLNCTYLLQSESARDAVEVKLGGRLVARGVHKCNGDHITLYDGDKITSPVITTWCGAQQQGKKFSSSGPRMLVNVMTDSHNSFEGAKVTYYSVPQSGSCKVVTHLIANESEQYVTSPNDPLYYPINTYCEYKIQASEGDIIILKVIRSKMEEDCSDNVQVYNGLEKDSSSYLGRWCGEDMPTFRSSGPQMLVVFSADEEFNTGGFKISYTAYKDDGSKHMIGIIIGTVVSAVVLIIAAAAAVFIFVMRKNRWLQKG